MSWTVLNTLACATTLVACGGGSAGAAEPANGAMGHVGARPVEADAQTRREAVSATASAKTACDAATGPVLQVGPGKAYAVPSAAAAIAQSGDVIKIDAGSYSGDVATWRASNLTICGADGRAKLYAAGRNADGKGLWVIQGSNVVVDSLEFHDAKVPDQNGAGIRSEGLNLTIRNSGFYDNENGILSGNGGTVTIDESEFARNGYGDGQSHNIYIGMADSLVVTRSYFHEARIGHQLKSRAKQTVVENSYFVDGPNGTASYLIDAPNGGIVTLRGNLFHKGPNADNSIAIAYGQEGLKHPTNTLQMTHNTIVSTYPGGYYLAAASSTQSVRLTANLLAGSASLITGFPSGSVIQQDNKLTSVSNFSGADSVTSPNFWPNARLRSQIALGYVPDTDYTKDAPKPFITRTIRGTTRLIGALQAAPR
jgi:hypothetical protein